MKKKDAVADKELPMEQAPKRKRGRPKTNGVMSGDVFCRTLLALLAFDRARGSGQKFDAALEYAAKEICCSTSEIKRILARYRSKKAEVGIVISPYGITEAEMERNKAWELPEAFWKNPKVYSWGIGPSPTYPRVNRADNE